MLSNGIKQGPNPRDLSFKNLNPSMQRQQRVMTSEATSKNINKSKARGKMKMRQNVELTNTIDVGAGETVVIRLDRDVTSRLTNPVVDLAERRGTPMDQAMLQGARMPFVSQTYLNTLSGGEDIGMAVKLNNQFSEKNEDIMMKDEVTLGL